MSNILFLPFFSFFSSLLLYFLLILFFLLVSHAAIRIKTTNQRLWWLTTHWAMHEIFRLEERHWMLRRMRNIRAAWQHCESQNIRSLRVQRWGIASEHQRTSREKQEKRKIMEKINKVGGVGGRVNSVSDFHLKCGQFRAVDFNYTIFVVLLNLRRECSKKKLLLSVVQRSFRLQSLLTRNAIKFHLLKSLFAPPGLALSLDL